MAEPPRFSADDIDALVCDLLRDEARQVDVNRMLEVIRQRFATEEVRAAESASPRPIAIGRFPRRKFAIAAALMAAVGLFAWNLFPAPLSAQSLVLAAQEKLASIDRCYRVVIHRPKNSKSRNLLLQWDWDTLVWTRGDRFRATMRTSERELVWGQDAGRKAWIVADPRLGLQFGPRENPHFLARSREILSLDLQELTTRFADSYDLEYLPSDAEATAAAAVIRATPRPDSPQTVVNLVSSARLVIDRRTSVILELQLFRKNRGGEVNVATFSLVEQNVQPDAIYQLKGNLNANAAILGPRQPGLRNAALAALLSQLSKS